MSQVMIDYSKLRMRSNILRIGKEWVNTPYQHQAMLKGVGADCVGLVAGVGIEAGVLTLSKREKKIYSGYGRLPNPNMMRKMLERFLLPCNEELVGDIAWIQWRQDLPMHLALLSQFEERRTLLHGISAAGKVVEHSLTPQWEERIVSFWRFPGLG